MSQALSDSVIPYIPVKETPPIQGEKKPTIMQGRFSSARESFSYDARRYSQEYDEQSPWTLQITHQTPKETIHYHFAPDSLEVIQGHLEGLKKALSGKHNMKDGAEYLYRESVGHYPNIKAHRQDEGTFQSLQDSFEYQVRRYQNASGKPSTKWQVTVQHHTADGQVQEYQFKPTTHKLATEQLQAFGERFFANKQKDLNLRDMTEERAHDMALRYLKKHANWVEPQQFGGMAK